MIDLHMHTTASDGRSTPDRLMRRVAAVGVRICAVTDHDTTSGLEPAREAAKPLGLRVLAGIEITAVAGGLDVHMLGYLFDPRHPELIAFLTTQREDRKRRIAEMLDRLEGLGIQLSRQRILKQAARMTGQAIGRPVIARQLVAGGHVRDIADAFDRYLGSGKPAFVPRRGATPAEVVGMIARAGGVASFAHPGKLGLDDLIPALVPAGLGAIEVFHPDHDAAAVERYRAMARSLNLAMTGGSDYHGPGSGRAEALGRVTLPEDAFDDLLERLPRADPRA
jgi:predicted metal-dependent phosphoesterase TrpH